MNVTCTWIYKSEYNIHLDMQEWIWHHLISIINPWPLCIISKEYEHSKDKNNFDIRNQHFNWSQYSLALTRKPYALGGGQTWLGIIFFIWKTFRNLKTDSKTRSGSHYLSFPILLKLNLKMSHGNFKAILSKKEHIRFDAAKIFDIRQKNKHK